MNDPILVFISHDASDLHTAQDLQRQLALAVQPYEVLFWDRKNVPPEAFRVRAAAFLEQADLFVALLSQNYEDTPDVRWEMATAIQLQASKPGLQILSASAREAHAPAALRHFYSALPENETIENQGIARDRQLRRVAEAALQMLASAPDSNEIPVVNIDLPLSILDLRERLVAQTDRINHAPLLALLKRLIKDVAIKRVVLDTEDTFKQLREQMRLSQISLEELERRANPVQADLQHLIETLEEAHLVPHWRSIFIRDYYHFTSESRDDSTVPPFFIPIDEISIPETLNLPVGPTEQESLEQIGLLSFEQKSEFRRSLLLAKDALAVKNPTQAFSYCDHVRQKIDPQSAQLYEYLLITFTQKETPERAMRDAVNGNDRVLQYILMFASRLRDYQQLGKCVSSTANSNLAIASESISDAALRIYYHLPNDPLRHTGKHADEVPDNRRNMRIILDNTLKVCRLVYPSEELLEAAVIESCGGGKCHWIEKVEVVDQHFQFIPSGHFDLLGEIHELLDMLKKMEEDDPNKIVKGSALLREDLYFSLLAKRQALSNQLAEDAKRRRPYTDVRESVIRFTYSCLLGAHVFGEIDARGRGNSFLRLALEYLLPGLLQSPTETEAASLRWFTLDENGQVAAHPECAAYGFDALGIVEKIVRDHAGQAGWLQVSPNIRQAVYLQYLADTEQLYEQIKTGLSWTDIRKMNVLDARRLLIECLNRWVVSYRAWPEKGQPFLEKCIEELIGDGILIWLMHNPHQLITHPESRSLGFDAQNALKGIHDLSLSGPAENLVSEAYLRERIAENLFEKRILKGYDSIKTGSEAQRVELAHLMLEALSNYKLHPNLAYIEFVWNELIAEKKLPWIDISELGHAMPYADVKGFDPLAVIREIQETHPAQFNLLDAREQIANHRHSNQLSKYFREISEFRHENRLAERQTAIEIIQKIKGIYLYYPKSDFLELAWDELNNKPGKSRIRWHDRFFGLFPVNSNHFENAYFNFDYKYERSELKRLLDQQYLEMQRVLRETGL